MLLSVVQDNIILNGRCCLKRTVKRKYYRRCCIALLSSITQFKLLDKRKRQPLRCRARILCSIQLTLIVLLLSCCTPTMRKFTHPQMHARSDTKAISLSLTQPTSLCSVRKLFPLLPDYSDMSIGNYLFSAAIQQYK